MNEKDIVDLIPLDKNTQDIANEIIKETDVNKIQDLVHLFNLNQQKKNVIRILKLNSLLDKVSDSMLDRFEKRPGEFSNTDLLNYMNTIQGALDKESKNLNLVDETPAIQLNQVNINVKPEEELSRESRDKITEAVKAIMNRLQKEESKEPEIIIEDEENIENQENSDSNTVLLNEENK